MLQFYHLKGGTIKMYLVDPKTYFIFLNLSTALNENQGHQDSNGNQRIKFKVYN